MNQLKSSKPTLGQKKLNFKVLSQGNTLNILLKNLWSKRLNKNSKTNKRIHTTTQWRILILTSPKNKNKFWSKYRERSIQLAYLITRCWVQFWVIKGTFLRFRKFMIWLEYFKLTKTCPCGSRFDIKHGVICKKGDFLAIRHNHLNGLTSKILSEVCSDRKLNQNLYC